MAGQNTMGTVDITIFTLSIIVYIGSGLYYIVKTRQEDQKKQTDHIVTDAEDEAKDYFLGGKKLSILPTATSLFASFFSAITVVGAPGEMYANGAATFMVVFGMVLAVFISAGIIVPFMYRLDVVNMNEYIEMRYKSKHLRKLVSAIMFLTQLNFMANCTFAPCIAFEGLTNIDAKISMLVVVVITVFYSTFGGLTAVVWVDLIQTFILFIGCVAMVVMGMLKSGGSLTEVWETASRGGRTTFFDMRLDPRIAYSFWACFFGAATNWSSWFGTTQSAFQRYKALPTLRKAQQSLLLIIPQALLLNILVLLTCLAMYSYYTVVKGCDPLLSGEVDDRNKLLPHFLMDVLNYPPIPGLYIAGMFAGSFSSISSGINAMASLVWEDVLKGTSLVDDRHAKRYMQLICALSGALSFAVACLLSLAGESVFKTISMFGSMFDGSVLSIFVFGAVFPWINKFGVAAGSLAAISTVLTMSIGQFKTNYAIYPDLPKMTDNCSTNYTTAPLLSSINATSIMPPDNKDADSFISYFFGISYWYFTPLTCVVYLLVASITSCVIGYKPRPEPILKDGQLCPQDPIEETTLYWYWVFKRFCHRRCACARSKAGDQDCNDLSFISPNSRSNPVKLEEKRRPLEGVSPSAEYLLSPVDSQSTLLTNNPVEQFVLHFDDVSKEKHPLNENTW